MRLAARCTHGATIILLAGLLSVPATQAVERTPEGARSEAGKVGAAGSQHQEQCGADGGRRIVGHHHDSGRLRPAFCRHADQRSGVLRDGHGNHGHFGLNKPVQNEILPVAQRSARATMISLADGYFDTLQLNDGTLFTRLAPNCERVENGVKTTHNAEFTLTLVAKLGCEEQSRMGYYRYNDRLRGRRYSLIDEERGLILAGGFIDKTGRLGEFRLTDGTMAKPLLYRPHTFYLLELFKIKDGAIEQIESNFITMPYHMPSPWDDWAAEAR